MTNLASSPTWEDVFRLEHTTPALGHNVANAGAPTFGANGPLNMAPQQLTNRDEWLRQRIERSLTMSVLHTTTYDLTSTALAKRAVRAVAGQNYNGANVTTLDLPAGEFLVVNECRWPLLVRGPSGVGVTVPARTVPNASTAVVFLDAIDDTLLSTATPPMRAVNVTSAAPNVLDSTLVTPMAIFGRGFLGVVDVEVNLNSIAYTVVSDTQIDVVVDGPAIGAVAGASDIQVVRNGGEFDIEPITFT